MIDTSIGMSIVLEDFFFFFLFIIFKDTIIQLF